MSDWEVGADLDTARRLAEIGGDCYERSLDRLGDRLANEAEIERLRAELAKAYADALISNMRYVDPDGDRAKVIEECARVAESWHIQKYPFPRDLGEVAAAIRALKDKP